MNIDRQNAAIELGLVEGDYLLGRKKAPAKVLEIVDEQGRVVGKYANFKDLIENRAAELSGETDRTVEVFIYGTDDRVAVYKQTRGELVIEG